MNTTTRPTIPMTTPIGRFITNAPRFSATSMVRTQAWLHAAYAHSHVAAYTYNGGDILYIIGSTDPVFRSIVHAVLVNATTMHATPVTAVDYSIHDLNTDTILAGWRYIAFEDLEACGAL